MKSNIIILFVFLALSFHGKILKAQTSATHTVDSLALIDFYNNMDGPNWTYPNLTYQNKWLQGRVATWYGVSVTKPVSAAEPYRVWFIDLMDNNLSGNIPPSIGRLIYLEKLLLSQNNITGAIPDSIKELSNLTDLALVDNHITNIPESIGSLTKLKYLWLSRNQINDTIPASIGNLNNLETFDISENQIYGSIPTEIGNMAKLKILNFYLNQISGKLPGSVVNLRNLEHLRVPYNYLVGVPDVSSLSPSSGGALQILWINNNRLTFEDIIPNMNIAQNFAYAPQDSVGFELTILAELGDAKTLEWYFYEGGNVYQWMKGGVEIPGAISKEFVVNLESITDFGAYTLKITNPIAPALTLYTRPINLPPPYMQFCDITEPDIIPSVIAKDIYSTEFVLKVVEVVGEVERFNRIGNDWSDPVELQGGETLFVGDYIYTGIESKVRLAFADCSTIVVQELTDIKIETVEKLGNAVNAQLWLKAGEVDAAIVEKAAVKSDFKVRSPTVTCSVRGTNFSVKYDSSSGISTVMISDGNVSVIPEYSPADSILLQPWQKVTVSSNSISEISTFSLQSIKISPDTVYMKTGRKHIFSAIGYDNEGNSTTIDVNWETEGGTVESNNLFTADSTAGIFMITATEPTHNLTATAIVIIEDYPVGVKKNQGIPSNFSLKQNYPNPFNPRTAIRYSIPEKSKVKLNIYDILGRLILTLVDEIQIHGNYEAEFNAEGLTSGIYFYRIRAGEFIDTKKMIFLK